MRVLVDGDGLARHAPRMRMAAGGLAMRGHALEWAGTNAPEGTRSETLRPGAFNLRLARLHADLVIGSGEQLLRASLGGMLTHAHALVVDVDPAACRRWSVLNQWGWSALHSHALVDPAAAEQARSLLPERLLERVGLWPEGGAPDAPDPAHPDVEVLERACERALARHRGQVPRAAVFLDRDGTLIVEREYLADPSDLELLPGVPEALQALRAAGFALIVVSNQSGVDRGMFSLTRAHEVMARLRANLRVCGVELDAIYFCPHRPDEGCACRKPGTLLLDRAAEDHLITLKQSVMIGDKRLDAETGQRAGGSGVLVRTGYGREEALRQASDEAARQPEHVSDDLIGAATWIIERYEAMVSMA